MSSEFAAGSPLRGKADGARGVALVWENLGPMHIDRCEAVARRLAPLPVTGIEFFPSSEVYDWERPDAAGLARVTLFTLSQTPPGALKQAIAIFRAVRRAGADRVFLCHYDRPAIMLSAWMLRLAG